MRDSRVLNACSFHGAPNGDEEARPLFERALALAPKGYAVSGGFGPYFTIQLAFLQREAGNGESAQSTARIARQEHAAHSEAGEISAIQYQTEALIAVFDQMPDKANAALRTALQKGFSWPLFLAVPSPHQNVKQVTRVVSLRAGPSGRRRKPST